jgi:6-phosphofructo-2-kinase/fructose-2,6-biphosphatase
MERWLGTRAAQIAVFDATNSTAERRAQLRARFHGRWQYLFIESICNDQDVLEMNYRFKMMYSPDYAANGGGGGNGNGSGGTSGAATADATAEALADFRARIRKYEEVYETITDRSLHYIKLIDMVTGKGVRERESVDEF